MSDEHADVWRESLRWVVAQSRWRCPEPIGAELGERTPVGRRTETAIGPGVGTPGRGRSSCRSQRHWETDGRSGERNTAAGRKPVAAAGETRGRRQPIALVVVWRSAYPRLQSAGLCRHVAHRPARSNGAGDARVRAGDGLDAFLVGERGGGAAERPLRRRNRDDWLAGGADGLGCGRDARARRARPWRSFDLVQVDGAQGWRSDGGLGRVRSALPRVGSAARDAHHVREVSDIRNGPDRAPFHATAGQVYWIAASSSRGQPPDPDICLRLVPGPANDDFAQATPLTGFPASAAQTRSTTRGSATREIGEPEHDPAAADTPPSVGSVWYSWTAPADRLVTLRVCGRHGVLAVYTGSRVDALTWVATRRARDERCGSRPGASVTFTAAQGELYRIAVASNGPFRLLLGTQVAVLPGRAPALLYTAFPGQVDNVKLRLTGSGGERALLVKADGVAVGNGCDADAATGRLRCPVPGDGAISVAVDLGDGDDAADVRLLGRVRPSEEGGPRRRVLGGDGNDRLTGSAGAYSSAHAWTGGLELVGGSGADRVAGGSGHDSLSGGPGPDRLDPGKGSDRADGGPGDDRVRTVDEARDSIRCQAGRDRARIDGIDLPRQCERRELHSPARAVATSASVDNDGGDDLTIWISPLRAQSTPRGAADRKSRQPSQASAESLSVSRLPPAGPTWRPSTATRIG
jgi:RTX calcium-binding nonapeptide repeat (4 copies)